LINDVISSIIEVDSLCYKNKIIKKIQRIEVVEPTQCENDSIAIPPPPPDGIYYDQLFSLFESENLKERRTEDSVFISLQTGTSRKYKITRDISSKFKKEAIAHFVFYKPIFSSDKQYVFAHYLLSNGFEASRHEIILKWSNGKWTKKLSW
jgi:hypothetical protein